MDQKKVTRRAISPVGDYVEYEDGSVDVICTKCQAENHLTPDSKWAANLQQIEGAYRTYKCLPCWKAERDEERDRADDLRREEIALGQAVNLSRLDRYFGKRTENDLELIAENLAFLKRVREKFGGSQTP